MTSVEIINELKQVDGAYEVTEVIGTYHFHRRAKNGTNQRVTVQIFDSGPDANPAYRYSCFATADTGPTATGNPDSSVEMVLMHMHWEHLDRQS